MDSETNQILRIILESGNTFEQASKKAKLYLKQFDKTLEQEIDEFAGLEKVIEIIDGDFEKLAKYGLDFKAKLYNLQPLLLKQEYQGVYEQVQKISDEVELESRALVKDLKDGNLEIENILKSKNLWENVSHAARKPGFNTTYLGMMVRCIETVAFNFKIDDVCFLDYLLCLFGNICQTCHKTMGENGSENYKLKNCPVCVASEDLGISSDDNSEPDFDSDNSDLDPDFDPTCAK